MGLQRNVASQKWRVFAFNKTNGNALAGDAAQITAKVDKDWAGPSALTDVNPTEVEDGYYFNFNGGKPYKIIVDKLLLARKIDDAMVSNIAKKISQGLSGKLDQYNKDGSMGELYNPILAAMVRSRCRLACADFIYDNDLQDSLIEVKVDGVTAGKKLDLPNKSNPGEWRIDL